MNRSRNAGRLAVFLDSSALIAGIISPTGAARALIQLGSAGLIQLVISEQVVTETERNLARKAPLALPILRQAIKEARPRIVKDPPPDLVRRSTGLVAHQADVPILLAAMQAQVGYFATLNRRHFMDDPRVAEASGQRIGAPGDALKWVRQRLVSAQDAGESNEAPGDAGRDQADS
jgi:hypothetical protein